MTYSGKVTTIAKGGFRVNINGNVSGPLKRLSGACRLVVNQQGVFEKRLPEVGDEVLCWFPGEALVDGYVVGIVEDD